MRDFLGHAVVNGELRFASVSSVKLYDPHTKGGCPRRWASRYVFGFKEPESEYLHDAKEAGIALDKEVKHYLRTGEKNLSALALKGLHILETPGPDLGLDVAIHKVDKYDERQPDGSWKFGLTRISSELTAAGVPFVGELDIVHGRGHYRDDDGQFYDDPPGTIEVADLKFKNNAKDREGNSNFFLPSDLVRDIQMSGYGEWVGRVRPNASNVRLSHLYFPKRPAGALPTKITRLHVLDDCRRTWEYVDSVVREMKDVAKEKDIERVPGNIASCDAYGGCPHRAYCTAYKRHSLDALYNKIAEDHAAERSGTTQVVFQNTQQEAPSSTGLEASCDDLQSLRSVVSAVSGVSSLPRREMCNMPGALRVDEGKAQSGQHRSLPPDAAGSWGSLSPLQRDARWSERQPDNARQSSQLSQGEKPVGLLANNPQMMQSAAQQSSPQQNMQQQLAQEEAALRAQVAQQQQQMPQAPITPQQLLEVCGRLGNYGFGMPSLAGNLAQAYAQAGGQAVMPGFVFQGLAAPPGAKRSLHALTLTEIGHVLQLEGELAQERAAANPQVQPVEQRIQQNLAQQYTPVPVAQMQPGFTQQLATAYNQAVASPSAPSQVPQGYAAAPSQPSAGGILPPGAPESMPQLAQVYAQQPSGPPAGPLNAAPEAQPAAPAKKKGRPPKAQDAAPGSVAPPPQAAQIAATSAVPPAAPATPVAPVASSAYPDGGINAGFYGIQNPAPTCVGTVENPSPQIRHETGELFVILVNARCDGLATKSLAGYVDYINEVVAKRYNTTKDGRQGPLDVRAAVDGSGLGFGGWKGFVREIVKVDPPPAGLYHFDTFMSELNEIVADALRVVAEAKGWLFVRGVRA